MYKIQYRYPDHDQHSGNQQVGRERALREAAKYPSIKAAREAAESQQLGRTGYRGYSIADDSGAIVGGCQFAD